MNDISKDYAELPRTAYLDHTLRRARTAAEQRSHRYVTFEHLLFSLMDDPDATRMLEAAGADLAMIRAIIADAVNNRMAALVVPDGRPPSFSYKFDALMAGASRDAVRLGRREVDGALAVIAIAKDADSNAAAVLVRNGFRPAAALQMLGSMPASPPPPAQGVAPQLNVAPVASPPAGPGPQDDSVEDMLASVRSILEEEERKESGKAFRSYPPPASAAARQEPRLELPLLQARAANMQVTQQPPELRANPRQPQRRGEPELGQTLPPLPRLGTAPASKQDTLMPEPMSQAPAFDVQQAGAAQPKEKRRRSSRERAETSPLITKALDRIPRRARIARGEIVEILLPKEDTEALFKRPVARSLSSQDTAIRPVCRAVTIRLGAPEGGFFIEQNSPETQWIFDRPSFLGDETFGRWVWTVVPNETGSFVLAVSIAARDVDENGMAADAVIPTQIVNVRIRGNFWRGIWGLVRTLFLLLAGSGITVGVYFALKMLCKLPH